MPAVIDPEKKAAVQNVARGWLSEATSAPVAKQVVIGGATGWCSGIIFVKVGKVAAIALGGSFFILQLAQQNGYISVNWNKVNSAAEEIKQDLEEEGKTYLRRVHNFARQNVYLAGGFGFGFLMGVTTAKSLLIVLPTPV